MLLANMSIARIISDSFPSHALLRRHEPPDEKLLEKVSKGLREYNIYINSDSSMVYFTSLACQHEFAEFLRHFCGKIVNIYAGASSKHRLFESLCR